MLVFQWKVPTKKLFIKAAGCSLQTAILPKMNFFGRFFFFHFRQKVSTNHFLDGYFYLLLSLKLFSRKKSVLLKLSHLITLLPRLDQSSKIYFAASWWALIIKARCNVVPLYCFLILRSSQGFNLKKTRNSYFCVTPQNNRLMFFSRKILKSTVTKKHLCIL